MSDALKSNDLTQVPAPSHKYLLKPNEKRYLLMAKD
jgi:hypothetical protein